jgi:hypothetical protein
MVENLRNDQDWSVRATLIRCFRANLSRFFERFRVLVRPLISSYNFSATKCVKHQARNRVTRCARRFSDSSQRSQICSTDRTSMTRDGMIWMTSLTMLSRLSVFKSELWTKTWGSSAPNYCRSFMGFLSPLSCRCFKRRVSFSRSSSR